MGRFWGSVWSCMSREAAGGVPLPLDVVKAAAGTAPREAAPSTEYGGGAKGGVCRSRPAQMSLRGAARLSSCTTRLQAALINM